MLCGLTRLALKIKYWLSKKLHADCSCFCPTCEYFDQCIENENHIKTALEEIEGKEIEYL